MVTHSAQHRGLDPTTPVVVGAGEVSERIGTAGYRALSAVGLAAEAARIAIADSGAKPGIGVDVVAAVRQFEASVPHATAPLGRSDNFPRSVADRVGINATRAVLEVSGGQSPQKLVTEFASEIAAGRVSSALVFGAEAISTCRHFAGRDDAPDFAEDRGGQLEDRGFGLDGLVSSTGESHGFVDAPTQYALLEHARRAQSGLSREGYAALMGRLFAPFTAVAAANEHAAAPTIRTADELVTVTDRNRLVADPYPRFIVARDQVNQGAAVLLMSLEQALRVGIGSDRMVFLHGHSDLRERTLLERVDLGASPAAVAACDAALKMARLSLDDIDRIDLYSCFPIAVSSVCDGLGLEATDKRGLTVTGGLPFFGGPGNNYSMHAIAEMVQLLRANPGTYGFVGANGGVLSKYSAAVYSTTPAAWRPSVDDRVTHQLAQTPPVAVTANVRGPATIESFTIAYARRTPRPAAVCREATGARFYAAVRPDDAETIELLAGEDAIGSTVSASPADGITWISATPTERPGS